MTDQRARRTQRGRRLARDRDLRRRPRRAGDALSLLGPVRAHRRRSAAGRDPARRARRRRRVVRLSARPPGGRDVGQPARPVPDARCDRDRSRPRGARRRRRLAPGIARAGRRLAQHRGLLWPAAPAGRPRTAGGDELAAVAGEPGLPIISSVDDLGRASVVTFAPSALGSVAGEPSPDRRQPGAPRRLGQHRRRRPVDDVGGSRRDVRIVASVQAFPATDPARPIAIIDLATLGLLRFEGSDAVEPADEWWLAVDDERGRPSPQALTDAPFGSRSVLSQDARGQTLATDPIALGIIGALAIGFVAAALFADRRVHRQCRGLPPASASPSSRCCGALGLSSGQLSVWLSLENAALAAVSLVAGTAPRAGHRLGRPAVHHGHPGRRHARIRRSSSRCRGRPSASSRRSASWRLGATVVALAIVLPRIGLAAVLRMSED